MVPLHPYAHLLETPVQEHVEPVRKWGTRAIELGAILFFSGNYQHFLNSCLRFTSHNTRPAVRVSITAVLNCCKVVNIGCAVIATAGALYSAARVCAAIDNELADESGSAVLDHHLFA